MIREGMICWLATDASRPSQSPSERPILELLFGSFGRLERLVEERGFY